MKYEDFLWNLSSIEKLTGENYTIENIGYGEVFDFGDVTITWDSLKGDYKVSAFDKAVETEIEFELSIPRCGICRSKLIGIRRTNEGYDGARVYCNSCGAREYNHWSEFIEKEDESIFPRHVNWAAAAEIIKKKEIDDDDVPF